MIPKLEMTNNLKVQPNYASWAQRLVASGITSANIKPQLIDSYTREIHKYFTKETPLLHYFIFIFAN